MADNVTVEKVEATVATTAVVEADKKVADIKAEKAAKKAERQNKRLEWKGPMKLVGKVINHIEDHPVATAVSVLAGVPIGAAGVVLYNKYGKKSEEAVEVETEVTIDEEANEAPFDAEA